MEYNTAQTKLINGEYGRHIQKMIEYAIEIRDRDLRNQQAKAIVRAMSYFSNGSKDTEDYWNKLWDLLFVISKFQLDVDSPFPKPSPKEIEMRPKALKYPKRNIRFRPYGVFIEDIINKVTTEEDSNEKEQAVANIANHLKRQYLNWNRDSVNDVLIHEHLELLSHGKLKMQDNFQLYSTRAILNDLAIENINNIPKTDNKRKRKKNIVLANANNKNKPNNNPNQNLNQNNNKNRHNNNNQNRKKNNQQPNQPKANINSKK